MLLQMPRDTENRNHTRSQRLVPAKVQIGFERFRPVRTLDVSSRGGRFEMDASLARGTTLAINLTPEPMRQLAIRGEVMWASPSSKEGFYEVGVLFDTPCKADRGWLERFFG